ncbi:cilia- and flagella-associated protein 45 [Pseudonaja textilis]|uniref:cilia- and flagella-associated protein 45 n=1 Tax=Pseudonaja textilis TaxID=8673 RepID=UPI000EA91884|nr:cilia- and flagella-associated protein 45 [Pseudonaja textilis]
MPSSVCSLGSSSNASSARSRSHSRTRYRTKAASSEVDESLFGLSKNVQLSRPGSPVVILHDASSARGKPLGWGRKPETIRIITRDLIRDLVVPTVDPSGESLIISPEDFRRIKESSRVLTKEEQEAQQAVARAEREATIVAVNERKKSMKLKEILRKKNEKLNDLEEEAKKRAQYLLDRANNLRMEQEDEIKTLGEIILEAKCHAIRDAQILEKKQIDKEMNGEEMRVDHLMEVERQKANEMQDELERKRKEELYRGRRHLIEQIEKNEEMRAMKAEQRDQEAQDMLEYLERLQFEDEREMERRRLERLRIQAEIRNINDENQRRKEEKLNQERLADMRVLEYQRQKMAREAEFEAEQEKTRREKEMETARLRALQEKAQDHQAEQHALRAKRNQEATEREWRRKEKDAVQKKLQTEAMLKQSRLEQVAQKEHSLAIQVQRDRAEFERIVRIQREQIEKERKEHERRVALQMTHADELRRQVREHQQKQVQERIAIFEEGKRLKEEARRRSDRLNEIKRRKLDELRAAGLPEKYCMQVERKAFVQSVH